MTLILEFASTAFLSIWNGLLFIVLLFKLCKTPPDDRYFSRKIVWSALITFSGWFISYSVFTIIKLNTYFDWQFRSTLLIFLNFIFTVMYSTSFTSSYVFAISMLYASFNNTQFQMSKRTLYFHLCVSWILFALCMSGSFFLYVLPNQFGPILHALNFMVYITGLCSLYFALNMKLIKMVMMANDKSKIYIFSPIQASFMLTVTKLSVLQGLFTSTVIIYVFQSIFHHLVFRNIISEFTDWIVYVFTVMIGTLSIYLTFKMNAKEYNFFCKCCDKGCQRCCKKTVRRLYVTNIWQTEMNTMRSNTLPKYIPQLPKQIPSNSKNILSRNDATRTDAHVPTLQLNMNTSSVPSEVSTHSIETATTNNGSVGGENTTNQKSVCMDLNVIFETNNEVELPRLTPASSLCIGGDVSSNNKLHEKNQSMLDGHNKTQSIVPIHENGIDVNQIGLQIMKYETFDDPCIDIDD